MLTRVRATQPSARALAAALSPSAATLSPPAPAVPSSLSSPPVHLSHSPSGSDTKTSQTLSSSARAPRSAARVCTICACRSGCEGSGASTPISCGVRRKGISSGTGSEKVALPKACPKSMGMSSPVRSRTKKLSRWRSPIPTTHVQIDCAERLRAKVLRRSRKASAHGARASNAPRSSAGGSTSTILLYSDVIVSRGFLAKLGVYA
mmetsp:Transcript_29193/g.73280  ORF Transcript_29193/g.73280 Transcript_29193/m.73280 type:complete len:206 (+) Transcript_29193:329-946(+)